MSTFTTSPAATHGHQSDETIGKNERAIVELNRSLEILVNIFPHILPEVFREMLHTFSGQSRLQIVIDQSLRHQDKWAKGRWRTPSRSPTVHATGAKSDHLLLPAEDYFRQASYVWAVKSMLYQEFTVLSRSTIKAVLAEENFSYTRSRPTLQKLAAKSWRNIVKVLWLRWSKPPEEANLHWMVDPTKPRGEDTRPIPVLKETGDTELDKELHQTVLAPFLENMKREQEAKDWEMLLNVHEAEAKNADAVYECECCFSDMIFEKMATCSTGGHFICFRCICQAVSEALFGQSWGQNMDHVGGQIKCLAPMSSEGCDGCIPLGLAKRAILQSKGGTEIWKKFESRLAEEALSKSGLSLVRCPFCSYAEVDELYIPQSSTLRYKPNTMQLRDTAIILLLTLSCLPLLVLYSVLCHLPLRCTPPTLTSLISTSLVRIIRSKHLPRRFQCQSPSCRLRSCLLCFKVWNDPHVCHESATLSLRTTIEAARTAALKRTCPRCGLAFIKESGCNKLTCVCGYTMCYVCRQGLGKSEGGEGYRHFCQHFRPLGGPCKECDKCDLYKNLNDERVICTAGAKAEKEWREREGMIGVVGIGGDQDGAVVRKWQAKDWTIQGLVDWWIGGVMTC